MNVIKEMRTVGAAAVRVSAATLIAGAAIAPGVITGDAFPWIGCVGWSFIDSFAAALIAISLFWEA